MRGEMVQLKPNPLKKTLRKYQDRDICIDLDGQDYDIPLQYIRTRFSQEADTLTFDFISWRFVIRISVRGLKLGRTAYIIY